MDVESLKIGDRVRTESGDVGVIVHIARLTMFVRFESDSDNATLKAFLASRLTKIDPPDEPLNNPATK